MLLVVCLLVFLLLILPFASDCRSLRVAQDTTSSTTEDLLGFVYKKKKSKHEIEFART